MFMKANRTQAYLWQVSPVNLTAKDRRWLDKAIEKDYHKVSIEKVLSDIIGGWLTLWRLGDYEGVLTTEIIVRGECKVLWVSHLAGDNVRLKKIVECLLKHAKEMGCGTIETAPDNPKLEKIFMKRFKKVATIFSLEVL